MNLIKNEYDKSLRDCLNYCENDLGDDYGGINDNIDDINEEDNNLLLWKKRIDIIQNINDTAIKRKEILACNLSIVDKEIADIHHYIELNKLNACQGWNIYNMLRSRLQKRRKIKDEISIVTQLIINFEQVNISQTEKNISKLSSRKYRPRVLKELFNN